MKYCSKCGQPSIDEAKFCGKCGEVFSLPVNMPAGVPVSNAANKTGDIVAAINGRVKAFIGIALAIAAILTEFSGLIGSNSMELHKFLTFTGFVFGVLAVVVSCLAKKDSRECKEFDGIATLALVISIIACAMTSLIFLTCTACEMCLGL